MYDVFEQLLKKYRVTAYKVSRETGITQSTLSDWKRGKSVPKTDKLQRIADYFGVSLEYLVTGHDNSPLDKEKIDAYFHSPELCELFEVAKTAKKENVKLIIEVLKRMKE